MIIPSGNYNMIMRLRKAGAFILFKDTGSHLSIFRGLRFSSFRSPLCMFRHYRLLFDKLCHCNPRMRVV